MLDSGLLSSFSTLEKKRGYLNSEYSGVFTDLMIRLTDKEYDQYVKKVVKILHKDEKSDGR